MKLWLKSKHNDINNLNALLCTFIMWFINDRKRYVKAMLNEIDKARSEVEFLKKTLEDEEMKLSKAEAYVEQGRAMTKLEENRTDTKRLLSRLVKNLICAIGIHRRDNNWMLKWSSKKHYCKCNHCGRYMPKGSLMTYNEESFYKYF